MAGGGIDQSYKMVPYQKQNRSSTSSLSTDSNMIPSSARDGNLAEIPDDSSNLPMHELKRGITQKDSIAGLERKSTL